MTKLLLSKVDYSLADVSYHTDGAAGFDLYLREDTILSPYQRGFFPSNIMMDIPEGYYVSITSRSSSFLKYINVFQGVIDSDYKKEVCIGIENCTDTHISIPKGVRIAQALLFKVERAAIQFVPSITQNGRCGFGST